jgi:hypothetical protein
LYAASLLAPPISLLSAVVVMPMTGARNAALLGGHPTATRLR